MGSRPTFTNGVRLAPIQSKTVKKHPVMPGVFRLRGLYCLLKKASLEPHKLQLLFLIACKIAARILPN